MKTALRASLAPGQTKLPPTRILSSLPIISSLGFHSHAAEGFFGEFWTASSTYGALPWESGAGSSSAELVGIGRAFASAGVDVIVKPPAWAMEGICTSSHWPGRKLNGCWLLFCETS